MRIILNGTEHQTTATNVAELLAGLTIDREQFLAVSRNGAIVKRTEWESTPLAEGDHIDILTIVGGG